MPAAHVESLLDKAAVAAAAAWPAVGCCVSTSSGGKISLYVADEASDVDVGQSLSKETRPERLHVHSRRLDEGVNLVLRDGDFVVVENEGGVDARELGDGGHGGGAVPVAGGERP